MLALDPELEQAYREGRLWAVIQDGVYRWAVERIGSYYFGPILGPAFMDHIMGAWTFTPPDPLVTFYAGGDAA